MKTDSQLLADVQAEFDWDPSFDNRGVVVSVKKGVATLAGTVNSYADKWQRRKPRNPLPACVESPMKSR